MKEFEKWDKNNKINYASISGKELNVQEERRKSWRAALKMVLEIKKNGDILAQYNDDILMAIEGEINKELEDEINK